MEEAWGRAFWQIISLNCLINSLVKIWNHCRLIVLRKPGVSVPLLQVHVSGKLLKAQLPGRSHVFKPNTAFSLPIVHIYQGLDINSFSFFFLRFINFLI